MFSRTCKPRNSFEGDALVSTEKGLKAIKDIQIRDKVWRFNENTGEVNLQEILHLIIGKGGKELVDITLENGEVISTTIEHPFYVGDQWVCTFFLSQQAINKSVRHKQKKSVFRV